MASQLMSQSKLSRVAKLRLEIERRESEARRLSELVTDVRARVKQLRKELAQVRRKPGRRKRATGHSYSTLNATAASTRSARRVGNQQATKATPIRGA
jgi:hypothetical protein